MPLRNRKTYIHYNAYNRQTQSYQGGDVDNHTLYWAMDDTVVTPTNSPVELTRDGRHICYCLLLTAEETNCSIGTLSGVSSTENVIVIPVRVMFEQVLGSGAVLVDHDYGGEDNLRYVSPSGVGIANGVIQAFYTSDYDAGRRSRNYILGETRTAYDGRWQRPLALDPGDYTLIYFKPGEYAVSTKTITVS